MDTEVNSPVCEVSGHTHISPDRLAALLAPGTVVEIKEFGIDDICPFFLVPLASVHSELPE